MALGSAAALCVLAAALPSQASNATLLFEGALKSAGGGPAADGDYQVTLALYKDAQGGTPLWSEQATVKVSAGQFAHALGSAKAIDAAVASETTLYLGVQVAAEPELTRVALHASPWALRASVASVALGLQCTGCVPVAALKIDDNIDLGSNALKASALTADKVNGKDVVAQTVTAGAFIGDGSKLTGVGMAAASCPKGQVVTGVGVDGKLVCASTASSLPADGLDEVSNGLLTTQFAEAFSLPAKDVDAKIPDNTGVDLVSTIDIGSIGLAESHFEIDVSLVNSDLSKVSVTLLPPDDKKVGITLCDPCGSSNQKALKTTYPKPTASKTGDLSSWIGKNPKGLWNLRVRDTGFCIPQLDKENCDVNGATDGKLLHWAVRFGVQSGAMVGVNGTFVVGTPAGSSAHAAALAAGVDKIPQAALVAGAIGLWTLVVPTWAAQNALATPGQIVHRSDLDKTFVYQGKQWRELQTAPMCGDQVRDGSEVCDGADLAGKDCETAYGIGSKGTLGCKLDCSAFDLSQCSEPLHFPGTKVLDAAGISKVLAFYGNNNDQWALCYRRSDDGAAATTFHSKCNNKGPTLTFIKTNTNQIFGGYAPISWKSISNYVNTSQSYLFSVTNNHKFPYYQNAGNAMYDGANYGPTWGGNHDLHVSSNMTTGYANPGHSHKCPNCNSCTACQQLLAGHYDQWQITELEVWFRK